MAIPGIKAIAHWALKVSDLERSLAFYRDTLGFQEMMRLHRDNGDVWLVYLRVTDTQFVELFPGGVGSVAPGAEVTAMNHVCLQVESIEIAAEALRKLAVPLTTEPKLGLDGNNQCWFQDPDGNRIELMQMLEGNMQQAAIKRMTA